MPRSSYFGLKEISKKVKEIVKKFRRASYKQISDIIVNEINEKDSKDEKNIRRRIYDSLNVMKAMNLFKKDNYNKYILWNGADEVHPTMSQDTPNKPITNEKKNFSFRKERASDVSNSDGSHSKCNSHDSKLIKEKKNLIVINFLKRTFRSLKK